MLAALSAIVRGQKTMDSVVQSQAGLNEKAIQAVELPEVLGAIGPCPLRITDLKL
jgi:hypothetical protein